MTGDVLSDGVAVLAEFLAMGLAVGLLTALTN